MTVPSQPPARNSRGRKLPASGASVPLIPSSLATAAPAASINNMNYINNMSNAPVAGATAGTAGNIYSSDPVMTAQTSQPDEYRSHTAAGQQGANLFTDASDRQITRVPNGGQVVRMPSFGGIPGTGIPQGLAPGGAMNMNIMASQGLMPQSVPFGPQPDALDRELYSRIDRVKKKRTSIPPFVQKLSSFVNDLKTDHLIRWSPSGNSFLVLDEDEFSKTLIPDLFKHNNYASFVRQLNMYGFHKVVGLADGSLKTSEQRSKPPSEYENQYFKRGQPDLMWLIQKPKSKKATGRGGKKAKQEEPDTDKEDGLSDTGGGDGEAGGGYLEGPKDNHGPGHQSSRNGGVDLQVIVNQIEAVRNHQAMISAAISRLRKDHQQLYEQSLAFQSLHDRHESSINAILTFLATVYDKSLGGHIGGATNNLFAHQVEHGQGIRGQSSGVRGNSSGGAIIQTTPSSRQSHPVMRTPPLPHRRQPLLLEGVPSTSTSINGQAFTDGQIQANSPMQQTFPIQELYTPSANNPDSPVNADSPKQLNGADNGQIKDQVPADSLRFSPIFSLPDSPTSAPATSPRYTSVSTASTGAPVQVPRSTARTLTTPLTSSARALSDHHEAIENKSQEISELANLQAAQKQNIDQLMGMMREYHDAKEMPPPSSTAEADDSMQYFDYDGLDAFAGGNPEVGVDIDELLRSADIEVSMPNPHIVGTHPSTVAASPATSSVGSRAREELEEEVEEVQPKRRRME